MPIWFLALAWIACMNLGHATTYYGASYNQTLLPHPWWTYYTNSTGELAPPGAIPTRDGGGNLSFAALTSAARRLMA